MFHRSMPAIEPTESNSMATAVATLPEALIPLVELELSLPAPVEGWTVFLAGRDIAITTDDIGRPASARVDARQLLTEQREHEARKAEMLAAADAAAAVAGAVGLWCCGGQDPRRHERR
jgi:hypothetical protein